MSKRFLLSFAMLFAVNSVQAQPDISHYFDSPDYLAFIEYVRKNLTYPKEARMKGIEGVVHLRFMLDESDRIIPESVAVVSGLVRSCDEEALRIVRNYTGTFTLKGAVLDKSMPWIVPLRFEIKDSHVVKGSPYIVRSFKAVVASKGSKTTYPNWSIYPTTAMDRPVKNVLPGDTVNVEGWGAWTFYITNAFASGFISYLALEKSPQVDSLTRVIEEKSPTESIPPSQSSSPPPEKVLEVTSYDTVKIFKTPMASFSAKFNKNSIMAGECVTLSIAFNVYEENTLPMQFWNLGIQVGTLTDQLVFPGCLQLSEFIEDVAGEPRQDAKGPFTEYTIIQTEYCPTKATPLTVPPLKLQMIVAKDPADRKNSSIVTFQSAPVTVNVKPLPSGINISAFHQYKMIGDYQLTETVSTNKIRAGERFQYAATVRGNAPTFPIEPPQFTIAGMKIRLLEIKDERERKDSLLTMRKTFVYECIAENTGSYDFKNKIVLKFHNPATGGSSELRSTKVIEVEGVKEIADKPGQSYFFDKSLLIAVDVSQSMQIEDYSPTRLEAIKQGLRKLAAKHNLCNVGIIQFGANFKHVALPEGETCYSVSSIDSISHRMLNGTAIGDAIWFGSVSAKKSAATKLVIIGDGDNTAGHLSAAYAASLAKSKGIKVYTIGVGNTGDVPYGRDYFNRPNMISNTFSDRDFKMVARVTGAEYVWAKDADAVAKALEKFLFGR